jgi:hypothetical protein
MKKIYDNFFDQDKHVSITNFVNQIHGINH